MKILVQISLFGAALLLGWLARKTTVETAPLEVETVAEPTVGNAELNSRLDLLESIQAGSSAELKELASRLISKGNLDEPMWGFLFAQWFKKDPQAAWDFGKTTLAEGENYSIGEIAIEQWSKLDPRAAKEGLGVLDPDQFEAFIRGMMVSDIELAFELAQENDDSLQHLFLPGSRGWQRRIADLAKKNPAAALAWANAHDDPDLYGPVLSGWFLNDPEGVRNWLAQSPDRESIISEIGNLVGFTKDYQADFMDFALSVIPRGNRREVVLQYAIENLAHKDPDFAISELHRLFTDESLKAEAIGQIAEIVARSDFKKAWAILQELDPAILEIRRVNIPGVELSKGGELEEHQGPFRYAWDLTSMRGLVSPRDIKSRMLTNLLMVDKERALEAMSELPKEQFIKVASQTMEQWMHYDLEEALSWMATKLGADGEVDDLRYWFDAFPDDQEVGKEILRSLPKGTVREAWAIEFARNSLHEDPKATLDFLRKEGGNSEAIEAAYYGWSSHEAKAALEHLAADPEASPSDWGSVTSNAFEELPEETSTIVSQLPAGKARDAAVLQIAEMCAEDSHPIVAAEWAMEISDEASRNKGLESILTRTAMDLRMQQNGELADQLREVIVNEAALSEEQKSHWLSRIETEFPAR